MRELEEKGVIERRLIASSPPSAEYALTDLRAQLLPEIDAIAQVGHKLKNRKRSRAGRTAHSSMAP